MYTTPELLTRIGEYDFDEICNIIVHTMGNEITQKQMSMKIAANVASERILGIETYLYDFDSEIYGEEIQVCIHEFKRPEQKFESLEQLVAQMQEDIEAGRHRGESIL